MQFFIFNSDFYTCVFCFLQSTPPNTMKMNNTAPKLPTKRSFTSVNALQKEAHCKKNTQKALFDSKV